MGSDVAYQEEAPKRQVKVAPFSIDSLEVTNARFSQFVKETAYITQAEKTPDRKLHPNIPADKLTSGSAIFISPKLSGNMNWWQFLEGADWKHPEGPNSDIKGRPDHPVVHIAYADAMAFAAWAGGDLPTEIEWEYAARGVLKGATYAWGEEKLDVGKVKANTWQGAFPIVNSQEDGFLGTAPTGCFSSNSFGLYDMTGNVWEWTKDSVGDENSNIGIVKGGSFLCSPLYCKRYRPSAKQSQEKDFSTSHIGFRLVYREDE